MISKRTIEGAVMAGRARALRWKKNFEREWNADDIETALIMLARQIDSLPDSVKEQVKAMHPEAFAQVQELAERTKENGNQIRRG